MKIKILETAKKASIYSWFAFLYTVSITASEVQMTGIQNNPNGVTIEWTHADPGYAYTLQDRTSLDGRNWKDVITRYRWPSTSTHWTVPGPPAGRSKFYRVIPEPIRPPERGKLISSELIRQFSIRQAQSQMRLRDFPTGDASFSVHYYKIVYETVDPFGLPILASGGLFVPQENPEALPLLSYQHGSEIYKPWVPSQNDSFWFPQALFYATSGYLTVMPDYLGLGDSPGLHPYLHAKTEASAVVDMLRAVKAFSLSNDINLNDQLFLTGYSQGGHATAAAQRDIEALHSEEFQITASAPMAGPYDLAGSLNHISTNSDYSEPFFVIFALSAWVPIYQIADTFEELLAAPFDQKMAPLMNGNHKWSDVTKNAGPSMQSMLELNFWDAIEMNPNHPFRVATRDNDLLDWTPQAPIRLYHCKGDDIVPFNNATKALEKFKENGACCAEIFDPSESRTLDHGKCFLPSLINVKTWFDSMKQ